MKNLLTVVEQDPDTQVRDAAAALAELLGVGTEELGLAAEPDADERVARVLEGLARRDAVGSVLSAQNPGGVYWEILAAATKPVLVVPPGCRRVPSAIARILLPLDGSATAAAGVAAFAGRAIHAGAKVFAVHVFDKRTAPAFWDHPTYSHHEWAREFRARNLAEAVQLDLRRGEPAEEVLAEVDRSGIDLVVLEWSQDLTSHKAVVVREILAGSPVPVLLLGTVDQLAG